MNLCILIGHLTKDPELRYTQSGKAVASFSIAIDRPYTNNGQKQADFFNVIAWGKLGENAAKYLSKGRQVAIQGRIENRNYETQSGEKRYITEIIAENVEFIGNKSQSESRSDDGYRALDEEDVPF